MSTSTFFWLCLSGVAVGSALKSAVSDDRHISAVSPTLSSSDKKFFGKDYPWDKRPKAEIFHFKHPYPAVQDSADFDSDFVKDENSDDGSYKAQTEYDRLRQKVIKERAQVAKALAAKKRAEEHLHETSQKAKDAEVREKKAEEEKKKKAEAERLKRNSETSSGSGGGRTDSKVVPGKRTPGGVSAGGELAHRTDDVEKEMKDLEDCKKQLAEARAKLKKLMEELEDARKKQKSTEDSLGNAKGKLDNAEGKHKAAQEALKEEYDEYLDAKKAYELQQHKVYTMEQEMKVAAEKVKRLRAAEDKDGGVYPKSTRSGAAPRSLFGLAAAMVTLAMAL